MYMSDQRQEGRYSLIREALDNDFLVSSARLHRKPLFGVCAGSACKK
jgi:hypothetical protein